jgi:hypothetical protein
MTRPRCFSHPLGMFVVERPPGRLGKRSTWVDQSGAVSRWCGFKHLRFATPARGPLHDSYGRVIGRSRGPSQDRARLTPQDTGQSRTISAPVLPNSRAGLLSPAEQWARIALGASRRREGMVGRQAAAHEGERGQSDE